MENEADYGDGRYDETFGQARRRSSGYNADNDEYSPEYILSKKILYTKLHELIDNLGEDDKKMVCMYMYDRMSLNQIAAALEISPTTLNYRFKKIMKMMEKELKDYR